MTITLDPRRIDRADQAKKHEGPFYGEQLRRLLSPEVTDPSWLDRFTDWWAELTPQEARFLACVVLLAVFCAAVIVIL